MRQFLIRNFKSICVATMILVFGACDLHPSEDVPIIDETHGIKFTFGDRYIDKYGNMPVLFAGGVMSNKLMRCGLGKNFEAYFSEPEFSADRGKPCVCVILP